MQRERAFRHVCGFAAEAGLHGADVEVNITLKQGADDGHGDHVHSEGKDTSGSLSCLRQASGHAMPRSRLPVLLLLLMIIACTGAVMATEPVASSAQASLLRNRMPHERPWLMVIGTPHLANHGLDVVNLQVDDVMTPARQAEIEAIVTALAGFAPTRVVVEHPVADQSGLDARYADYRAGRYTLGRSEVDQIGLRLAARLGLPRVDAGDWNGMPPGDIASMDWDAYARRTGKQARVAAMRDPRGAEGAVPAGVALADVLARINAPAALAERHRRYYDYAMLGDDVEAPGANWMANWHGRNLRIFARLVRLAEGPQERVLVVYGAGHAPLLRQFAEQSGAFLVVDPVPYLRAAAGP